MQAEKFRVEKPDLHFDHAYISTYQRAVQTSLNFLSMFENKPIDLIYDHDLRERSYGFENFINMKQLIRDHGIIVVKSWDSDLTTKPSEAGETQHDVYSRVMAIFDDQIIPKLMAGDNVLVVSHFYVLKALMSYMDVRGPSAMLYHQPKNCLPYSYDLAFTGNSAEFISLKV
jgi:2,3-bisphosphoglycerate-dependent phosphoglycerate mutase